MNGPVEKTSDVTRWPSEVAWRSDELLARAREIFGADMVVDAQIVATCSWMYGKPSQQEVYQRCAKAVTEAISTRKPEIELMHGDVILTFCNGRRVQFSTSEWGQITGVADELTEVTP